MERKSSECMEQFSVSCDNVSRYRFEPPLFGLDMDPDCFVSNWKKGKVIWTPLRFSPTVFGSNMPQKWGGQSEAAALKKIKTPPYCD